jgi:ribosomal protein S18 acetylase RimI-like enzyme
MKCKVRKMEKADLVQVSSIHTLCFPRQRSSYLWLSSQLNCSPPNHCFSIESNGELVGYAIWKEESGLRKIITFKLESLGIHPRSQGQGIEQELITRSFQWLEVGAMKADAVIGGILVTTREDNEPAKKLYKKTLGVREIARIPNFLNSGITEILLFRDLKGDPNMSLS